LHRQQKMSVTGLKMDPVIITSRHRKRSGHKPPTNKNRQSSVLALFSCSPHCTHVCANTHEKNTFSPLLEHTQGHTNKIARSPRGTYIAGGFELLSAGAACHAASAPGSRHRGAAACVRPVSWHLLCCVQPGPAEDSSLAHLQSNKLHPCIVYLV